MISFIKKKHILLLFIIFFALLYCSSAKQDWEKARSENTITSYREFLSEHSRGKLAEEARRNIDLIRRREIIPEFQASKTVKVSVKETYGNISKRLPFESTVRSILEHAGLDVAEADAETYDLTFDLDVRVSAGKKGYLNFGTQYAIAIISGTMRLSNTDGFTYEEDFSRANKAPGILSSHSNSGPHPNADSAPFQKVWQDHFLPYFLGKMKEVFGPYTLILALEDENPDVRLNAVKALKEVGEQRVFSPLFSALTDKDYYVRGEAHRALLEIGDPPLAVLDEALKSMDKYIKRYAILALGQKKESRAAELLVAALYSPGVFIEHRDWADTFAELIRYSLVRIGEPAFETLISAYRSALKKRDSLRESLKNNNSMKALRKKNDFRVGDILKEALLKLGKPAIEGWISVLEDANTDIRHLAATALREIDDPRAIPALIEAINDEESRVRNSVRYALESLTGKKLAEDQDAWQKWWEENKERFKDKN